MLQTKRKSEVKKSDVPGATKATAADPNSLDAKEKAGGQKPPTTPEIAPGLKPVAKADESVEEKPKLKDKRKSILKPASVEVELEPTQTPTLKPVATVEVSENETPKPKPALKPVATVEVDPPTQPVDTTMEVTEQEPQVKPAVLLDENITSKSHKSRYAAPKTATKKDMELLYELDNEELAELKEVCANLILPSPI
jgi:hypothetical protein